MGDDVSHHNAELERVVISGCNAQAGSIHELRLHDLHQAKSVSVAWLVDTDRKLTSSSTVLDIGSSAEKLGA